MKAWKEDFLKKMEEASTQEHCVTLSQIARELGIKHISSDTCRFLLITFCKRNPGFKPYILDGGSLFTHGYASDNESFPVSFFAGIWPGKTKCPGGKTEAEL